MEKKLVGKKLQYEKPELVDVTKSAAKGIEGCVGGSANDLFCDNGQAATGMGCVNGVGATGSF